MNHSQNFSLSFAQERQAEARKQIRIEHLLKQNDESPTGSLDDLAIREDADLWQKAFNLSTPALAGAAKK